MEVPARDAKGKVKIGLEGDREEKLEALWPIGDGLLR